jgi:hypothetical protein
VFPRNRRGDGEIFDVPCGRSAIVCGMEEARAARTPADFELYDIKLGSVGKNLERATQSGRELRAIPSGITGRQAADFQTKPDPPGKEPKPRPCLNEKIF